MVIFLVQFDAQVFLFTDMLLITRPSKKSPNQLVIAKAVSYTTIFTLKFLSSVHPQPYKIDSLIVKPGKDPG